MSGDILYAQSHWGWLIRGSRLGVVLMRRSAADKDLPFPGPGYTSLVDGLAGQLQ